MKIFKPYLHTFFLLLLFCSPLYAQEHSPQDTVNEWIKVYGIDQAKASELTTLRLRDGRTKEVWAEETSIPLKQIGYKHLGGKIIGSKVNEKDAMVYLRSAIETIVGRTEQTEVYLMYEDNGKWLIENIVVGEEELEELKERELFLYESAE